MSRWMIISDILPFTNKLGKKSLDFLLVRDQENLNVSHLLNIAGLNYMNFYKNCDWRVMIRSCQEENLKHFLPVYCQRSEKKLFLK
ncbi:MAG: hypothetical protein EAZ76_00285 [Nostocales cyanobacterium]|nr:MAG: hypothetical protein EAZ76_00285 [Nostocales cyanobacterium]